MPNPITAPPGYQASPTSGTNNIPVIPTAVDLTSALVAINVIAQAIAVLANASIPNAAGNSSTTAEGGTFVQTDQVTEEVVITDPNNSSISVTVEQVTSLTMRNPVTGELWIWTLG